MFTELIKLQPILDPAAWNRMFSSLSKRFTNVAKKFSDGMKTAFKFGGVIGLVTAVVGKLLNPLERAEELYKQITGQGDDATANAEELGTTPGKLLRLQYLAQAKGMDAETLRSALGKYQGAIAKDKEVVAAPGRIAAQLQNEEDPLQRKILEAQLQAAKEEVAKGSTVRQFSGDTDMAESFLNFFQSVSQLEPSRRTVIQTEILGEKARGKGSEFYNTKIAEADEILKGMPSAAALGAAAEHAGALADLTDKLTATRQAFDFITKSALLTEKQAYALNQGEINKDNADNRSLQKFDSAKNASIAIQELTEKFDKFSTELINTLLPQLVKGVEVISKYLPNAEAAAKGVAGAVGTVMNIVPNYVENAAGVYNDPMGAIANDIKSMKAFMENTWADIKNSPLLKWTR